MDSTKVDIAIICLSAPNASRGTREIQPPAACVVDDAANPAATVVASDRIRFV